MKEEFEVLNQLNDIELLPDRIYLAERLLTDNPQDDYLRKVLCYLPRNYITPFVVWTRNTTSKDYTFGGCYFSHFLEAVAFFNMKE